MTPLTTKAAEIRAGLVADWRKAMEGVTPGPYFANPKDQQEVRLDYGKQEAFAYLRRTSDVAWVVRCSPAGISDLLNLIEQQAAELADEKGAQETAERGGELILADLEQAKAELAEARRERDHAVERYAAATSETAKLRERVEEQREAIGRYMNDDVYTRAARAEGRATTAESERDELLREKERLGAGWLPIETAPKDGTHVLLYAPASEYKGEPTAARLTYGYWLVEEHGAYLGDCGGECRCPEYDDPPEPYWFSDDGGFTKEDPPTRWMPLPSAPSPALENGPAGLAPLGEE